jgi:O-antigen/teichoic acid export membrane protein
MHEVLKGASSAFAIRALGVGCGFAFNVLLGRVLGANGVGIYFLALTLTTIATIIGRMGLDHALLRYIAAGASIDEWKKVGGIYRKGMQLAICTSGLTSLLMFFLAPWIATFIFKEDTLIVPLRIMAVAVLPFSLFNLHAESLKALKATARATFTQGFGLPFLNLMILVFIADSAVTVKDITVIYLTSSTLIMVVGIILWRRAVPRIKQINGSFTYRQMLATSFPLFWVSGMSLLMNWTDTIMLGIWIDSRAVGIYGAALRTASLTSFILFAVNSIAAPKFSALYSQGQMECLGQLARRSSALMTFLASPILLMFIFFPQIILRMFGTEFIAASSSLIILTIGQFINVVTGSVGYLLIMTGYEKLMRNNIIFSSVLNVLLNVVLIPHLGIVGAALSTSISLSTMNLISATLVYSKLSILTLPFHKKGSVARVK